MDPDFCIGIAGRAVRAPAQEIPGSLEELIYGVVADALSDAGLTVRDIDGVCMAASDLNDGRAISTMTLTGSTGSLGKNELRVCNDSLAAVWVGAAEIASEAAEAIMVCTWSKLSDADPDAIRPLALEPAFHRALGYHPDAVVALRQSHETATPTRVDGALTYPVDTAAAMVITAPAHPAAGRASIIGCGSAMGAYLSPGAPLLKPLTDAVQQACHRAGLDPTELSGTVVPGLDGVKDAAIGDALGVPADAWQRLEPRGADLGYAAGQVALDHVLQADQPGRFLVATCGGIGLENAHAIIVEVK